MSGSESEEAEYELSSLCNQLLAMMMDHELEEDGEERLCCASLYLPAKEHNPAYYTKVKKIVDFKKIQERVKRQEYDGFKSFIDDFRQLFANIYTVYTPGSTQYNDGKELEQMFADQLKIMISLDYFNPAPSSPSSVASFLDDVTTKSNTPEPEEPTLSVSPARSPFKTKMKPNISPETNLASAKKGKPGRPKKVKDKKKSKDPDSEPEFVPKTPKIKLKVPKTKNFNHDSEFDFEPNKEKFQNTLHGLLKAARTSPAVVQTFQDLPDKDEYPEYYEVIPIPVSLSLIQERVDMGRYQSIYHCVSDIMMMCANAFTFNEVKSKIYKQAQAVKQGVLTFLAMMKREELFTRQPQIPRRSDYDSEGEVEGEEIGSNMMAPYMWRIYNEVLTYTSKGRILCIPFLLLPELDELPLYYEEISQPMSLSRVKSRIVRRRYESLSDMADDIDLMFNNAMHFNKDNSQIYRDSLLLREVAVKYTEDIEQTMLEDITKFKSQGRADQITQSVEKKREEESPKQRGRKKGTSSIIKSQAQLTKIKSPLRSPEGSKRSESKSRSPDKKSSLISQSIAKSSKKKAGSKRKHLSASFKEEEVSEEEEPEKGELGEESLVEDCIVMMEAAGDGLVGELCSTCTHLFRKADNIAEVEEHLVSQQKPATSLLLIVTGLMARLDPMCDEHVVVAEIQSKLVKYIKAEGGNPSLLKGVPVYSYKDDKYVVQEELLSVFRYTKEKTFLRDPKITREVATASEVDSEPKLDILSEDAVMIKLSLIKDALAAKEQESSSSEGPVPKKLSLSPRKAVEPKLNLDKKLPRTPSLPKKNILKKTPGGIKKSLKQKLKDKGSTAKFTPKRMKTDLSQFDPDSDDEPVPSKPMKISKPSTPHVQKVYRPKESLSAVKPSSFQCENKDKFMELIMSLKELRDSSGRITHSVFQTLPIQEEVPEYYSQIKFPMAIGIIENRICNGKWYAGLDSVVSAVLLMVRNALNFNEEDAKIYEDALDLQCELIKKRKELLPTCPPSNVVPETLIMLQERFQSILDGLHSDLAMISVIKDLDPKEQQGNTKIFHTNISLRTQKSSEVTPLKSSATLSEIRHSVACGYYLRLDHFQDQILQLLAHALRIHPSGDEHKKVLLLYKLFFALRDKYCKDVITSSAFAESLEEFNERHCTVEPKEEEMKEEEEEALDLNETLVEGEEECGKEEDREYCKSFDIEGLNYQVGDYIEIKQGKNTDKTHIVCIEKMWSTSGDPWVKGHLFMRPEETCHAPNKPFYTNEVFKSDYNQPFQLNRVLTKCLVQYLKDYKLNEPEDPEVTVYICDSRYQVNTKMFIKIKLWKRVAPNTLPMKPRETPTNLAKTVLEKYRQAKEEKMEVEEEGSEGEEVKLPTISRYCEDNVEDPSLHTKGNTYYFQYNMESLGTFKIGDFVYLRSDNPLPFIARIDKIYEDNEGTAYVTGPWFIRPNDTKKGRQFFDQEVLQSNIVDTNPMQSIEGWCYVLTLKDYITKRPTEALNKDVYVCESKYDEGQEKFSRATKLYNNSQTKCQPFNFKPTEWYIFVKPLTLQKVDNPKFEIPLRPPPKNTIKRSYIRQPGESQGSPIVKAVNERNPILGTTHSEESPMSDYKSRSDLEEGPLKSGYALYVMSQRGKGINLSPKMHFAQWKQLDKATQDGFQERFEQQKRAALEQRQQQIRTAPNFAQARGPSAQSSGRSSPSVKQTDTRPLVYCCKWKDCQAMFECGQEYHFHVIDTRTHLHAANSEWRCYWRGCISATATEQGLDSQILLRRHLLSHVNEGATKVNKLSEQYFAKQRSNPQPVLQRPAAGVTHSEPVTHTQIYRNYIKKLDSQAVIEPAGGIVSMKYSNWFSEGRIAQPTLIDALHDLQQGILRSCTKLSQWS